MYLYQPGRKPSRQFRYDIMMFGPDPHGEPMALQLALTTDECSHPRRAVDVVGRIMCSESVPMVNATAIVVANRTGTGPQQIYLGMTNNDGTYRETAFIGYGTRGYEVLDMVLMFVNTCGDKNPLPHYAACTKIPMDYAYAYEEEYPARKFSFNAQVDIGNHSCNEMEEIF
ncbi:hypothetical protein AAVH_23835 [Aphelenchoides avenae]|nr:hypothetical protein AAVH_23835 [Aphelenchus avenae]